MATWLLSALNRNWNNGNRLNVNGNNLDDNNKGHAFGIALSSREFHKMKTYKNLYSKIYDIKNLVLAWKKARKNKTKKIYVIEFEKELPKNLKSLQKDLIDQTYYPKPLENFILCDPKTRKISKADFRDRVVHHAICNVIEHLFDETFIYDNSANRKGKGNLFAIKRFYSFVRKVSRNGRLNGWFDDNQIKGYCLKADIKHYFQEIDSKILLKILQRKICCEKTLWLIKRVIERERETQNSSIIIGLPLGNLTSQFFANVYLNELDQFVKHKLGAKYYIRYVDDFVILHSSKSQLKLWKKEIELFLNEKLNLELHKDKSRIIPLSRGIDFVGFRNFYNYKLLRTRNIRKIKRNILLKNKNQINKKKFSEIFQGWNAYADHANTYWLKNKLKKKIK